MWSSMIDPVIPLACGAGFGMILVRRALGVGRPGDSESLMTASVRWCAERSGVATEDLDITGRSLPALTSERLLVGSAGFVLPIAILVVTGVGGVSLSPFPVLASAILGGFLGYQVPLWQLKSRAAMARRRFRTSLSAYLDLVAIMLAGGAGIETALFAAGQIGDGPAFLRIGEALEVSRTSRRSPWDTLADLGRRLAITELPELAATVRLGGEQGARMTASLVAKASALRAKQMAEVEAEANAATEKMGLPMVMLFLGFLILLGYPAMYMIEVGFQG